MKKKIPIVEDNKDSIEILGLYITKLGHQAIKAKNSNEAIAFAEAEDPDLIFMDMELPDVDGVTTTALSTLQPDFTRRRRFSFQHVQPELTFRALSLLLITFLAVIPVVFTLVSMWKENRFGWPLRGIIWFIRSHRRFLRRHCPSRGIRAES